MIGLTPVVSALIGHLLSWPVAVFLLALVFKKPIGQFLHGLSSIHVKAGHAELTATGNAATQLEQSAQVRNDPLAGPPGSARQLLLPDEVQTRRAAVRAFGGNHQVLDTQMETIKTELSELHFELGATETTELLIRHLATTQLIQRAETLYRLIYGSQIEALKSLSTAGPQAADDVRDFYEWAKARAPRFYRNYTFEQWIDFLVQQHVICLDGDGKYLITPLGREFLGWITSGGFSQKKH